MKQSIHAKKLVFQTIPNRLTSAKYTIFCCLLFVFSFTSAQERTYQVPPSSAIAGSAPGISDTDMEQCVEIFNEATWLKEELNSTQVDLAQPASVDAYNSKASLYAQMSDYYNANCAGKTSEPAIKAAQKLNQQITQ